MYSLHKKVTTARSQVSKLTGHQMTQNKQAGTLKCTVTSSSECSYPCPANPIHRTEWQAGCRKHQLPHSSLCTMALDTCKLVYYMVPSYFHFLTSLRLAILFLCYYTDLNVPNSWINKTSEDKAICSDFKLLLLLKRTNRSTKNTAVMHY